MYEFWNPATSDIPMKMDSKDPSKQVPDWERVFSSQLVTLPRNVPFVNRDHAKNRDLKKGTLGIGVELMNLFDDKFKSFDT